MMDNHDDQLAIVLGQRQLVAVCCMFLVILGLVATLAYVAGRSITASQMRAGERGEVVPAIMVDPAKQIAPAALEARAETAPIPIAPVPAREPRVETIPTPTPIVPMVSPKRAPTVVVTQAAAGEPRPGDSFWQVGVVDRGMADVFVEFMMRLDLPARRAPAGTNGQYRVLVGPVHDSAESDRFRRAIEGAGFQTFLKRY